MKTLQSHHLSQNQKEMIAPVIFQLIQPFTANVLQMGITVPVSVAHGLL